MKLVDLCFLGRGGNAWLSPPGCAMFSLHLRVPQRSLLGERIPFLQHIVSLAVVLGVRQKPGYEVCLSYLLYEWILVNMITDT